MPATKGYTMLSINSLTKTYSKSSVKAVNNLNLKLNAGEIFGFLGPNGAGKSTTIKCLTGILPYENGTIEICGHELKADPVKAKRHIGYVPDGGVAYDKLTGLEYINFMSDMYGVSTEDRKARAELYLAKFGLTESAGKPIKSYSHGMQQKINIIGALIHEPELWVLDEPMTGLDPQSAYELKELMREHCNKGYTVFFSSHVLDVVEKICDRVGIINKGELVSVFDIKELKEKRADLSLEEFFLSVTK